LEVLATIRRHALSGQLGGDRCEHALEALVDLRLTRYPHTPFRRRIWELRQNLTPYDAAYVALAEGLDAPLLTLDGRLARASGARARVELLGA